MRFPSPQEIAIRVGVVERLSFRPVGLEGFNFPCLSILFIASLVVQLLNLPPQPPRAKVGQLEQAEQRETDAEPNLAAVGT